MTGQHTHVTVCVCLSSSVACRSCLIRIGIAGWRLRHNGGIRVWGQLCEMQ